METEYDSRNFINTDVIPLLKIMKPAPNESEDKEQEEKKIYDENANVYDLIKQILKTNREINDEAKYYDLFEDIAIRIKEKGYYLDPNNQREKNIMSNLENLINKYKKEKEMLKPPVKTEEGGEPTPITQINFIPDYFELFNKLSFSGINFGEKDTMLLNSSLRNLAINQPNGNVSFFGMIYGTEKDYYIAEVTEVEPPENFNYDADMEKRKEEGVNRNVFFVTNNLLDNWIELPDIKPSQIIASRKIKYIFTGNLNNPIYSNPQFNGLEKHYLRCQIARIYHSSKLVLNNGHYQVEDADSPFKDLAKTDKQNPFTFEEISDLKYWIHYPPGILNCGRISHIIDEPPENVDPDEYKKQILAKDPFDTRIKSVLDDNKIAIGGMKKLQINAWKINQFYENNIYINPYVKVLDETSPDFDPNEKKDNKANYLGIGVKSLRWPGAMNFYIGKELYFFYFGNGQKFSDKEKKYVFKDFPLFPQEMPDKEDQPEPHLPKELLEEKKNEKVEENKEEAPNE